MATILMRRRWRWIGQVIHQEASITKTAVYIGRQNGTYVRGAAPRLRVATDCRERNEGDG